MVLPLKGSNFGRWFDPFRVGILWLHTVGVALRSPTAINFNPFGIQKVTAASQALHFSYLLSTVHGVLGRFSIVHAANDDWPSPAANKFD